MRKTLILVLIGISSFCFAQEKSNEALNKILNQDSFNAFDSGYLLTLSAYIPDCGEFGGHNEIIEIKKKQKNLIVTISISDTVCDGTYNMQIKHTSEYPIKESELILIDQYLIKLLKKSFKNTVVSHADYDYSATLTSERDKENIFSRFNIRYWQYGEKWSEFDKLKQILKK